MTGDGHPALDRAVFIIKKSQDLENYLNESDNKAVFFVIA